MSKQDDLQDFFLALEDLEREKGINQNVFIEALQNALALAYKKQINGGAGLVEVRLDPVKPSIKYYSYRVVVEVVEDEDKDISLEEAQTLKKSYKLGDFVYTEFKPQSEFSRIAAQTAKQIILQKLHELERDNSINEFSDKEGELLSCIIRKIDKNIYVELGKGQLEGVMIPQDQTPGEKYAVGDKLMVYVKKVRNDARGSQVLVSRSSPGLVKRLFENEVPEIKQGIVLIKAISREAGQRTKIAIYSTDENVDAVGACVGARGMRVNAVVEELNGEKIDIIPWSENPLEFIANALSPARVISVTALSGDRQAAEVIVPDDKLSLAIGRDGQNARLSARLTGWKIDVKSQSAAAKLENAEELATAEHFEIKEDEDK